MKARDLLFILVLIPSLMLGQDNDILKKKGVDTTYYVPKGLKIGDEAPNIIGVSMEGLSINSSELLKNQEIVVIFYRGEWCPICNRYLSYLSDSLEYIQNKKAKVIVVGPENKNGVEETMDKTNAQFTILSDTSMQIQKDYDVLFNVTKGYQRRIKTFLLTDIAKNNSQEEAKLPVPATYIISKEGIIKWRHFDYDYSKRASVKSIIDNLD
jgi:peroxiredoxin